MQNSRYLRLEKFVDVVECVFDMLVRCGGQKIETFLKKKINKKEVKKWHFLLENSPGREYKVLRAKNLDLGRKCTLLSGKNNNKGRSGKKSIY